MSRRKGPQRDQQLDAWIDRAFYVGVPVFLGWLLSKDASDGVVDSDVLVVVLAGYGTGLAAAVVRKLAGLRPQEEDDDDS